MYSFGTFQFPHIKITAGNIFPFPHFFQVNVIFHENDKILAGKAEVSVKIRD